MLVFSIVRSVGVATVLGGTARFLSLLVNLCVQATRPRPVEDIMLRGSSVQGYLVGCSLLYQETVASFSALSNCFANSIQSVRCSSYVKVA